MAQGGRYGDVLARARTHRALRIPVIPDLAFADTGKDSIDGRGALVQDGGNHNRRAEQELAIGGRKRGVVGELPRQGTHDGTARGMGEVEEGVDIRQ